MRSRLEPLLCELHAHTTWSDGELSLRELVDLYGRHRYDVLCVTDHVVRAADPWYEWTRYLTRENHAAYVAEIEAEAERARLRYGLLLVPGLELTYNDRDPLVAAHAVAVGCRDFVSVDRSIDDAMEVREVLEPVEVAGGDRRLFNQDNLYGWVAEAGLSSKRSTRLRSERQSRARTAASYAPWSGRGGSPYGCAAMIAAPPLRASWKTLLPCSKDEDAVVDYLRSARPVYLARLDDARAALAA
jgi:hypothetical protein